MIVPGAKNGPACLGDR